MKRAAGPARGKRTTPGGVRAAVIGLGNMGRAHARLIADGAVPGLRLAAVCDPDPAEFEAFPGARGFTQAAEMLRSGCADALVIATPHYSHVPLGIAALQAGWHVLVEKPIAVDKAGALKLAAAPRTRRQVFAAMFNQRTNPAHLRVRELVRGGAMGAVRRVAWTVTHWFRTEAYYRSARWRGTWAGEGGGVLVNQCPHQLDLLWWWFGMPERVQAWCARGRYHRIEVEDDVTARLEYRGGMHALFVTSTGEAPGTNRLEIALEGGRVVLEGRRLCVTRNDEPMTRFSRAARDAFARPSTRDEVFEFQDEGPQHLGVLRDFERAIREGTPPLAPAGEGVHSVELANAMLLSSERATAVSLPLSAAAYTRALRRWSRGG
jgi:predicted dehydrogenase